MISLRSFGGLVGPNNTYTIPAVQFITPIEFPGENNLSIKEHLTERSIKFINALQKITQLKCKNTNCQNIKPLIKVLHLISGEENLKIKESLVKKNDYFTRFFSNESWTEWTEDKTALGRVVSLYVDHETTSWTGSNKFTKRLDNHVIEEANREAARLLRELSEKSKTVPEKTSIDCSVGLFVGASSSFITQNPIPFGLAGFNCLSEVSTHGNRNQGTRHPNHNKQTNVNPVKPSSGVSPSIYNDQEASTREDLYKEVAERIPKALKRVTLEGHSWADYLIAGGSWSLDVIGITTPMNDLKDSLRELEVDYWCYVVRPVYLKIFPDPYDTSRIFDPTDLSYGRSSTMYTFELKEMRDKLKSHGYNGGQTPLQFIRYLGSIGTCELKKCNPL